MDYAWLEPRHDPIATDTNLAEIDFENFKNEDLAYAFSCGEEESGGSSSTDMSICRSEPLFSSTLDSEMRSKGGAAEGVVSLIQDSIDEDFNFREKVVVNKNNYTLTYSGQGMISSLIASMVIEEEGEGPEKKEGVARMTTWSNLSRSPTNFQQLPPHPVIWSSNNNNAAVVGGDKAKSLPECDLEAQMRPTTLVNTFMRGRSTDEDEAVFAATPPTMIRSKDTVNTFLKATSRLTSIEETTTTTTEEKRPPKRPHKRPPSFKYPDLDFLENDVGLWDTFFARKNRFQSVLRPPLPVEEYLKKKAAAATPTNAEATPPTVRPPPISDTASLRALLPPAQKHLVPIDFEEREIKQAWPEATVATPPPTEAPPEVVRRRRKSYQDRNLNLLNNNGSGSMELKRRSYHPQDYLSKLLDSKVQQKRPQAFPKSGSQNDLVDSCRDSEETEDSSEATWSGPTSKNLSAEYPFHNNLAMPAQGINFDLTHKRGLFVNLYTAVEHLLMYQDDCSAVSVKFVLFHELCPALMGIMRDGLKPEVITSFGRMKTSVWRVIEAVIRQGPNFGGGAATSDLVMLLNAKFPGTAEDHRKFSGFVAGLLNMSGLHVWFSKLKWSMDVLLRFYERHAFICALHKETRLLFDELIFCLQRLYALPTNIDLPFTNEILDDIPTASGSMTMTPSSNATSDGGQTLASSGRSDCSSCNDFAKLRRPASAKSRIPRPISLPKRLEAKLSPVRTPSRVRASPNVRSTSGDRKSRVRDTVKLFDSKMEAHNHKVMLRRHTRPKTGAGEAMALEDHGRQQQF